MLTEKFQREGTKCPLFYIFRRKRAENQRIQQSNDQVKQATQDLYAKAWEKYNAENRRIAESDARMRQEEEQDSGEDPSEENDGLFQPDGYNENNSGNEKEWVPDPFDEDGKLKPNVRYDTGKHAYHYETDSLGRICKAETKNLQLKEKGRKRHKHDGDPPGKNYETDQAGHLFADWFDGSPKIDNVVAQLYDVNKKHFFKLECLWAKELRAKNHVAVTIYVDYVGDSMRPSKFTVLYSINGGRYVKKVLDN